MYNDADILEKILKEKRKELGPSPEENKVKLSRFDRFKVLFLFWFKKKKAQLLLIILSTRSHLRLPQPFSQLLLDFIYFPTQSFQSFLTHICIESQQNQLHVLICNMRLLQENY